MKNRSLEKDRDNIINFIGNLVDTIEDLEAENDRLIDEIEDLKRDLENAEKVISDINSMS